MSGLPMRAKCKDFRNICEQTFDNSPMVSFSLTLNLRDYFFKKKIGRYSCSPIRCVFPRISSHAPPCLMTRQRSLRHLFQPGHCLTVPAQISDSSKSLLSCAMLSNSACSLAVYTPSRLNLLVPREQLVSPICPTWVSDCSSFPPFF